MKKFKSLCLMILILIIGMGIYHKEILKKYYPKEYHGIVKECSVMYGLDESIIYAIMKNESDFQKDAESRTGAKGLMQIMPATAKWIQSVKDFGYENESQLFQEEINIRMGCWYLKNLMDEFHDMDKAVAAYNAGRGNVAKWLRNEEYAQDEKLIVIPFKETDIYLKRVIFVRKMYEYLYDN